MDNFTWSVCSIVSDVGNVFFSLLVLEGVIIDSRTEPRNRISLLLVNHFSLLTSDSRHLATKDFL
jgi:hypothetical protein